MSESIEETKYKIEKMIYDSVESLFKNGTSDPFDVGLPSTDSMIQMMLHNVKHTAHRLVEGGEVNVDMERKTITLLDDFEPNVLSALPYAVPEMVGNKFDVFYDEEKIGEAIYGGEIKPRLEGTILHLGFQTDFAYTRHSATITLEFADEEKDPKS